MMSSHNADPEVDPTTEAREGWNTTCATTIVLHPNPSIADIDQSQTTSLEMPTSTYSQPASPMATTHVEMLSCHYFVDALSSIVLYAM
jgi:hypothetical protein